MSLRLKIGLIVALAISLLALSNYAIQRLAVYPSFVALERDAAQKDIKRCRDSIRGEISHLGATCNDWAAWDDTYAFMAEPNEKYKKSNLIPEAFIDAKLNLLYLVNLRGETTWGRAFDLRAKQFIKIKEFSEAPPLRHAAAAEPSRKARGR